MSKKKLMKRVERRLEKQSAFQITLRVNARGRQLVTDLADKLGTDTAGALLYAAQAVLGALNKKDKPAEEPKAAEAMENVETL